MRRIGVLCFRALFASVALPGAAMAECHPSYAGGCVPVHPVDVDCDYLDLSLRKGNGPAYALSPFTVVGEDVYGLDRNGDGVACEWSRGRDTAALDTE
ncbi:hypothetical protein GQA70_13125 [Ponticoccus alexandrii]|uniref:Excalibur calcium-binding domain-containing protein n=2 Tax=Ponticoccus alexandrii TaxID=1943633 RepID=A0ABX7FEA9_9RHOB|nr:hypothetical protein GQA70_13125 [Ponticoccus alexandrii]